MSADRPAGLTAAGVTKAYGSTKALVEADIDVRPGEVLALVGGNGSGKSTLVKILAGVVRADSGTLRIRNRDYDLSSFSPSDSRRCGLHMVHQHRTTFDELSVVENLSIGRGFETDRFRRIRWSAARKRAKRLIEAYGIDCRPDDLVGELRPAAQTMVEIARSLQDQDGASDGVLVLDEPTASLPPHEVEVLLRALQRFARAGQAVLFISHRLDEVLDVADRVTALRDGRVVATLPKDALDRAGLIELIAGREVAVTSTAPSAVDDRAPVLTADGLSGGSVQDVSLALHPGEIVGVAGLAGSGRSSLLRMIFGAQKPRSGALTLQGERFSPRSPADAMRRGVAFVPEDRPKEAVFPELSIAENLSIGHLRSFTKLGLVDGATERAAGRTAVREYGVKARSERTPIADLSGGNQQKVSLARWLVGEQPSVLLLDEPTQGVDVGARSELWEIVRAAASRGVAILLVSSDLEELVHLSQRILILRDGRVVGSVDSGGLSPESVNHKLHSMEVGA